MSPEDFPAGNWVKPGKRNKHNVYEVVLITFPRINCTDPAIIRCIQSPKYHHAPRARPENKHVMKECTTHATLNEIVYKAL